jgi:hypothetical protein
MLEMLLLGLLGDRERLPLVAEGDLFLFLGLDRNDFAPNESTQDRRGHETNGAPARGRRGQDAEQGIEPGAVHGRNPQRVTRDGLSTTIEGKVRLVYGDE